MTNAQLKSIKDILDKKFIVKTYQRGYRWEKTEIEELLTDLYNFQDNCGKKVYCLQPIVVKKDKENDIYELVDGQQRLTAIWLILMLYEVYFHPEGSNIYSIEYEGKVSFTNLLNEIKKACKDDSLHKIDDVLNRVKTREKDSIDAYMLIESMKNMKEFSIDSKNINLILSLIMTKLDYIGVIWYELDDTEDSIQFFVNLNANKVPLTDAELIKAAIYHSANDEDKEKFVNEWQEIEKKLHDEELWYFITYDIDKNVRIEYLFEIWCFVKGKPIEPKEKNPVFHAVNNQLAKDPSCSRELWNEIKSIFEAISDWKSGYYSYHAIGLLTLLYEKKDDNVRLIKELYALYKDHKKSEFKDELKKRICEYFIGTKKSGGKSDEKIAEKVDKKEIEDGVNNLRYRDSLVRPVLYLYNIALLVEAGNMYERFQFKAVKVFNYDVEHVNPQTPESKAEEKKEWLEQHKKYSNLSEELKKEIEDCLANDLRNFENTANNIRTELKLDEDCIGNLVLLDSSLNRSYKNNCFMIKRNRIIEKLRNTAEKQDENTPVLPGTKWVFLKEYNDAETNTIWTNKDVDAYSTDIADRIYSFFS